jgi:Kef-type K+ transport system membrane component KefB
MTVVVSLAAVFVIATIATVRWAGHHLGHALLAFLAGLFIATTSAGPVIRNAIEALATTLFHAHR